MERRPVHNFENIWVFVSRSIIGASFLVQLSKKSVKIKEKIPSGI